ncbi:MAG: hypothetical protein ACRDSJ_10295 [Rubrobacteraceae bacterium]
MRRMILVAVAGALVLALAAGVAIAQNIIQCDTDPCTGTNQQDRIFEQEGDGVDDTIRGRGKGDVIDAANFDADNDNVFGGRGNDRIRVDDRDPLDFVSCGKGNKDIAVINPGDEASGNCEFVRGDLNMTPQEFSTATVEEIIENSEPAE